MKSLCLSTKYTQIVPEIKRLAREFGFTNVGITDPLLSAEGAHLNTYLAKGYAGEMTYLQRNVDKRLQPQNLVQNTKSIICLSISYPTSNATTHSVAAFAQIDDYHQRVKALMKELIIALKKIPEISCHQFQAFCGSAPILEKSLAANAGLGWVGKNTLLLNEKTGSYQFLGEIFTDLHLPPDSPSLNHCGNCRRCLDHCPTQALVGPYQLDARKCISYLTIEYKGVIPVSLRSALKHRIFGCDVCQNVCPWNQKRINSNPPGAIFTSKMNFINLPQHELFSWDEATFKQSVASTPIQRLSYECWLRNLALALGNSTPTKENIAVLKQRLNYPSELVKEHVAWALAKLRASHYG